ncbi:MAG TPA: hypothetical protein VIQ03_08770 [Gammaproteobacteria bacterium]
MADVADLIAEIIHYGKAKGMDQKTIASFGQISAETLSRKKRGENEDMYVSTLSKLAHAVGLKLVLVPDDPVIDKINRGNLFE